MDIHKIGVRISWYLSLVLLLFIGLKMSGIKISELSADTIVNLAHNNIILVLLIMLLIMTLQNLFTFIPLVLVITINISLFGFWIGYFFSCFCSVIGSTLIFLSIRYVFSNLFTSARFKEYNKKIEKNGFKFVLFGRIFPFLPTNLINIVSGLSSINLKHFLLATTLGNMIYGFVLSTASFSVITMFSRHPYWTIATLILAIGLYFTFIYLKKQKQTQPM